MNPRVAVDMPAFLLCGQVEEGTFSAEVIKGANALGMPINVVKGDKAAALHGNWLGIQREPEGNGWLGATTAGPRGQVMGY